MVLKVCKFLVLQSFKGGEILPNCCACVVVKVLEFVMTRLDDCG